MCLTRSGGKTGNGNRTGVRGYPFTPVRELDMNGLFCRVEFFTWAIHFEKVAVASSIRNCMVYACLLGDGMTGGGPQSCIDDFSNNVYTILIFLSCLSRIPLVSGLTA